MAEMPRANVELDLFPGLMEDADPDDLPAGGAEVQINATCVRAGQLVVRGGLRQVSFDS